MVTTVVGASTVVAVDRTVLDADKVSSTFEEEGIEDEMTTRARDNVRTEVNASLQGEDLPDGIAIDVDSEAVAEQVITESYVSEELTRNIEAIIAFLEGDTDELTLEMNTEPVKQSLSDQFDEESVTVETVTLAQQRDFSAAGPDVEIDDEMIVRLNEDQDGYSSVRHDLRSDRLEGLPVGIRENGSVAVETVELATAIDFETAQADIDVTDQMIEDLNRDAAGYAETRATIRQQVRSAAPAGTPSAQIDQRLREINEEMKANAAEQARTAYGDDVGEESLQNIIALQNTVIDGLTDPDADDYTEYTDRRDANERALESSLTTEIEHRLRETGADIRAEAASQAESQYGDQVGDETLQAIIDLQTTVVRGFTDPDLQEFSTYESQRDANETALEASIASEIQQRIDSELDDQISLGDNLTEENEQLRTAQSGLGLIGTLAFVLPLLFVGLAGLVYALTRSLRRTVSTAGYALLVGGAVGAISGTLLGSRVVGMIESNVGADSGAEAAFADAFVALVQALFDTHVTQSALLAVFGLILLVVVYAERNGYLDSVTS